MRSLEVAYADARAIPARPPGQTGKPDSDVPVALAYLQSLIEPISPEAYGLFEESQISGICISPPGRWADEARQRLRGLDFRDFNSGNS
ncbi:MAG TPA: hypothetical protein VK638_11955, partial [Edaphobacter sp.]|nr:hypothetical protein [Edaphobacter sp.]